MNLIRLCKLILYDDSSSLEFSKTDPRHLDKGLKQSLYQRVVAFWTKLAHGSEKSENKNSIPGSIPCPKDVLEDEEIRHRCFVR